MVQFTQPRSTVTIQNDDVPSCALADTSVPEGDSGTTTRIQVVAQCDAPLTRDLTLHVTSADDTATADQDYAAINLDNDYAAGQTTLPVEVEIDGDVEAEPDETFTVKLIDQSGSGSVAFTKDTATVTITDDDSPTVGPCILLSDTSECVGHRRDPLAEPCVTPRRVHGGELRHFRREARGPGDGRDGRGRRRLAAHGLSAG